MCEDHWAESQDEHQQMVGMSKRQCHAILSKGLVWAWDTPIHFAITNASPVRNSHQVCGEAHWRTTGRAVEIHWTLWYHGPKVLRWALQERCSL